MTDARGSDSLVLYGDLPVFYSESEPTKITFGGHLTHSHQRPFERLLVRELSKLAEKDLSRARVAQLRSAGQLRSLLRAHKYSSVTFYGHTITLTTAGAVENRQEIALAGAGQFMSAREWATTLSSAGVRETLIAGCASVSFAAGVVSQKPEIRSGGLLFDRQDRLKASGTGVLDFQIRPQPIKWWPK